MTAVSGLVCSSLQVTAPDVVETLLDELVSLLGSALIQRVAIIVVLAGLLGYVWHLEGRGRWRAALTQRFVYGVPWGSLITLGFVIGFYLFVQSGLESWHNPAVSPFRSWSYSYLAGMLAAGFAHAGPGHLVGNMLAAAVLSPLAEYAWGHYPQADRDEGTADATHEYPPPSSAGSQRSKSADPDSSSESTPQERDTTTHSTAASDKLDAIWSHPVIRAVVIFPSAVFFLSILTSVFAWGWSLGYSGTVFLLLGFVLLVRPLATIVSMVVLGGVAVLYNALQTPVLVVGLGGGAPGPPGWAGVNVQAHLLGFLLGLLVAFELARRRDRWPNVEHFALAVVIVGLARSLWSLAISSGGTFYRYQALGVVFVLFIAGVAVAMVSADDDKLVGPLTVRGLVAGGLALIVVILALVSIPANLTGMDDDPVPETNGFEIEDYTITYAENVSHGRVSATTSGVVVVSEQRSIWTTEVGDTRLAHSGGASVVVGGFGWREVVEVDRSAWNLVGNESVYAVDLEYDGETIHAYQSGAKRTESRLRSHNISVVPEPGEFRLRVHYNDTIVGSTPIPESNSSISLDLEDSPLAKVTITAQERDGTTAIHLSNRQSRILIAERA